MARCHGKKMAQHQKNWYRACGKKLKKTEKKRKICIFFNIKKKIILMTVITMFVKTLSFVVSMNCVNFPMTTISGAIHTVVTNIWTETSFPGQFRFPLGFFEFDRKTSHPDEHLGPWHRAIFMAPCTMSGIPGVKYKSQEKWQYIQLKIYTFSCFFMFFFHVLFTKSKEVRDGRCVEIYNYIFENS